MPSQTYNSANYNRTTSNSSNDTRRQGSATQSAVDSSGKYPIPTIQSSTYKTQVNQTKPTIPQPQTKEKTPGGITEKVCLWCHYQDPEISTTHRLHQCFGFNRKSPSERTDFVMEQKVCIYCLNPGHRLFDCSFKPDNTTRCNVCNYSHHHILGCLKHTNSNVTNN